MKSRRAFSRWMPPLLVLAFAGPAAAITPPASASACGGTPLDGQLYAVAATSGTDAWAVGVASKGAVNRNIALHWDGTAWHEVPVPEPDRFHDLLGVTATSASNAWAVGDYGTGTVSHTLTLQWNGMAWARVPSPSPGGPSGDDQLQAVAATSATNAWAVGSYDNGQAAGTLILNWDGTAWTQVPSP